MIACRLQNTLLLTTTPRQGARTLRCAVGAGIYRGCWHQTCPPNDTRKYLSRKLMLPCYNTWLPCNVTSRHYLSVSGLCNLCASCLSRIKPVTAVVRPAHHRKVMGQKFERLGYVMCHVWFVSVVRCCVVCGVLCSEARVVSVWRKWGVGVCVW